MDIHTYIGLTQGRRWTGWAAASRWPRLLPSRTPPVACSPIFNTRISSVWNAYTHTHTHICACMYIRMHINPLGYPVGRVERRHLPRSVGLHFKHHQLRARPRLTHGLLQRGIHINIRTLIYVHTCIHVGLTLAVYSPEICDEALLLSVGYMYRYVHIYRWI